MPWKLAPGGCPSKVQEAVAPEPCSCLIPKELNGIDSPSSELKPCISRILALRAALVLQTCSSSYDQILAKKCQFGFVDFLKCQMLKHVGEFECGQIVC